MLCVCVGGEMFSMWQSVDNCWGRQTGTSHRLVHYNCLYNCTVHITSQYVCMCIIIIPLLRKTWWRSSSQAHNRSRCLLSILCIMQSISDWICNLFVLQISFTLVAFKKVWRVQNLSRHCSLWSEIVIKFLKVPEIDSHSGR